MPQGAGLILHLEVIRLLPNGFNRLTPRIFEV